MIVLLMALALPFEARADEVDDAIADEMVRPRILVVFDADAVAFATHLEMELIALGYIVERRQIAHQPPEALPALAQSGWAVGVAQVRANPNRVDVWAGDPRSGKKAYHETVLPPADGEGERVAVIRAADMVRAALIEVGMQPVPKPPPPLPMVAPEPIAPIAPPSVLLSVNVAVAGSPGGVPPTVHGTLVADVTLIDALSLGFVVVTPGLPGIVRAPEGQAAVFASQLGADLDGVLQRDDQFLGARLGLGIAATWLHMEGSAIAPRQSLADDVFVALPYARAAGWLTLLEPVRIVAETRVGLAAPRPVVVFDGRQVAHWGRPMVLGSLGIGFAL